jgi:hypothetical protein
MNADPSRIHEPANTKQIADARHAARQALAALRAVDPALITGDSWSAVGRCASALIDVSAELERVARRL